MRNTVRPEIKGCKSPNAWFARHKWEHSHSWNGNNRKLLPFVGHSNGIARSGWRCFHCGKFEWDQTDREYAISIALAYGAVSIPKEPK